MRTLVWIIICVALVGGFLAHRHSASQAAKTEAVASAAAQPAAPREVSEHNWAKHSLDRAADVKRQVAEGRKANQDP